MKINITPENCKISAELAGSVLAEKLGLIVHKFGNDDLWYLPPNKPDYLEYFHYCSRLAYSLDLINELEEMVITTVGYANWMRCLLVVADEAEVMIMNPVAQLKAISNIARTPAHTRLCACLIALGIIHLTKDEN